MNDQFAEELPLGETETETESEDLLTPVDKPAVELHQPTDTVAGAIAVPPHTSTVVTGSPASRYRLRDFVREFSETLILTLLVFWIINTVTGRYMIDGRSMVPTFEGNELIIINKFSYFLSEPQRGDIIVLDYPLDRSREFIKRVIGLPGDEVIVRDGSVMVNGVVLDEPYIAGAPSYEGNWTVPEDDYFVLGDNRNNSSDSHNWTFLPRSDIVGKAWLVYWRLKDFGLIQHYEHSLE